MLTKEIKILVGCVGVGMTVLYLRQNRKIKELSEIIEISTDKISDQIDIPINEILLSKAVQKAVDREISVIGSKIGNEAYDEIKRKVSQEVHDAEKMIKNTVTEQITAKAKAINMYDVEKEVIKQAKETAANKFEQKLDSILGDFNENLSNIQKIYASIATSMSTQKNPIV